MLYNSETVHCIMNLGKLVKLDTKTKQNVMNLRQTDLLVVELLFSLQLLPEL